MTATTGAFELRRFVPALCLAFLSLPAAAGADGPTADEVREKASQEYLAGHYAEAAARFLEIADKHPGTAARRYAVQMLGTLYEDKLVDVGKAIEWDRKFLNEYAGPRQVSFYQEKLATLERLKKHEEAFATYQAIRFADQGDAVLATRLESLLRDHPDFPLKAQVRRELAYAYARLDERRLSHQSFEELSRIGGAAIPVSDRMASDKADRYWRLTRVWGGIAWGLVAVLWAVALLMKPWERMTRASVRSFVIWAAAWLLLAAVRLPSYYAAAADENPFTGSAVYVAAGLNLAILLWMTLLTRGNFWRMRPRALRWASPLLTMLMTTAVLYLFIIHQPKGTEIMDAFAVKYRHWMGE